MIPGDLLVWEQGFVGFFVKRGAAHDKLYCRFANQNGGPSRSINKPSKGGSYRNEMANMRVVPKFMFEVTRRGGVGDE